MKVNLNLSTRDHVHFGVARFPSKKDVQRLLSSLPPDWFVYVFGEAVAKDDNRTIIGYLIVHSDNSGTIETYFAAVGGTIVFQAVDQSPEQYLDALIDCSQTDADCAIAVYMLNEFIAFYCALHN